MVEFKNDRLKNEWKMGHRTFFPFSLRDISNETVSLIETSGATATVTSVWRSHAEDKALGGSGIHCLWRAVDFHASSWDDPAITRAAAKINADYIYDPKRPMMVVADFQPHGTGPHLHIQVCGNTEKRNASPETL